MEIILPQLKDIVHFVFYGYMQGSTDSHFKKSVCMSVFSILSICLISMSDFSVLLYFLSMFVVSVCLSFLPVCHF